MKTFFLSTLISLIVVSASAQTGFVRYVGPGNVVLHSGDTIKGELHYMLSQPETIRIFPENGERQKLNYNGVKEFSIFNKHYYTIKTNLEENPETFALILNPKNTKIKIFMYEQQPPIIKGDDYAVTTKYFVLLPNEESALSFGDEKFYPFHKKMSEIVESCPTLSQKILKRETGFKLDSISSDELRLKVFRRVAAEFENCN